MNARQNRIDHARAFVLTSYPWRETSLWVEIYSRDYGRVPLLARSARKPQSALRGVLMPFAPLSLSWFGANELRTLHTAEWLGGLPQPANQTLLAGMYVNELMLKLTARDDADARIFDLFEETLRGLCHNEWPVGLILRRFEWQLLSLQGLAPDITKDDNGMPIEAAAPYLMLPEHAPQLWRNEFLPAEGHVVTGSSLLLLQQGIPELTQPSARQELLHLNRKLLSFRLPEGLSSRRLLEQLQQLY